jgi:hypothetical protein
MVQHHWINPIRHCAVCLTGKERILGVFTYQLAINLQPLLQSILSIIYLHKRIPVSSGFK